MFASDFNYWNSTLCIVPGMSHFGARIKALREQLKFPQKELARQMGRPASWVHNRESGTIRLDVEDAEQMVRIMGLSAAMVVTRGDLDVFMRQVEAADPAAIEAAGQLLRAWPHIHEETRAMILGMFKMALDRAEGRAAG